MPASAGADQFWDLGHPEIPLNWVDSDMLLSKLDQDRPISAVGSGWFGSRSRWAGLLELVVCVVLRFGVPL